MTKLTLGPIAYHWSADERRDFYARIADEAAQSESYVDLLPETARLVANGVTHLRLMPQDVDMVGVARLFRETLECRMDADEADAGLRSLCGGATFSNGLYHGIAGHRWIASAVT